MKRIQFFELEDFDWFPSVIREGETDYLQFCIEKFNVYKPSISELKKVLTVTNDKQIIDLCSGGGGACVKVSSDLLEVKIIMTDKFPNLPAFNHIFKRTKGKIDFDTRSIDALDIPQDLKGMRTMFSAFHHFTPNNCRKILKNAVENNQSIGIFEAGERSIIDILGVIITSPILFFIFTPFIRPFKLSRIFFTYVIPLIPLSTMWDGVVSMLRMYNPSELLEMAANADVNNLYVWKAERIKYGISKNIYLTGYPKTYSANKGELSI